MKANDLKNANELAAANNLTRCTQSVVRDTKRNQLIVTEEVSRGFDTPDYRKEISYFFFEDVTTSDVNPLLYEAKALATFRFLGINDKAPRKPAKAKVPECSEGMVEPEGAPEPEGEAPAVDDVQEEKEAEKPKPRARKPRSSKSKPTPEPVAETDDESGDDDALGLDDDDQPEAQGQLYTKGKQDHAIHLRDLIVEKFGKEWKKDQKAVLMAKKLVLKLDQKVHVVDDEGDVLESFKKEVKKMMGSL